MHLRPTLALAACAILALNFLTGCASTSGAFYDGETQHGYASWYSIRDGIQTASGERFDDRKLTAAHRRLPFGTIVRVTNEQNGRSVEVRINDRGPWTGGGRIIDLSSSAADQLDMKRAGIVPVDLEILELGSGRRTD
jgi:rare lipoprotein A